MRKSFIAFGLVALTLGGVTSAKTALAADVTIVSETTLKGLPEAALQAAEASGSSAEMDALKAPMLTKAFFKNDKTRTESGKTVVIFDGATGTTFTLSPADKTYTAVKGMPGFPGGAAAAENPLLSMMKMDVKTFVNPGSQTQTIAGQTAKNYRFMAVFKMSMGGGEKSAGVPANINEMLPTIILKGEEWTVEGLLPEAIKAQSTTMGLAGVTKMMPMLGGSMKDFAAKMAAIKGFPVASTLSTSFQFPEGAASMMGGMIPKDPIVVTTRATSVSTDALDDALFAPPADYKKVELPVSPEPPAAPVLPSAT